MPEVYMTKPTRGEIYSTKYKRLLKNPGLILSALNDKEEISDTELEKRVSEKARMAVPKKVLKEIIKKLRQDDSSFHLYIEDAEGGKYYVTNDLYIARRRRVEFDLPMFLLDPPYVPVSNARGATLPELRERINEAVGIDIPENELETMMQKFMEGGEYATVKKEGELYKPNTKHDYFRSR